MTSQRTREDIAATLKRAYDKVLTERVPDDIRAEMAKLDKLR